MTTLLLLSLIGVVALFTLKRIELYLGRKVIIPTWRQRGDAWLTQFLSDTRNFLIEAVHSIKEFSFAKKSFLRNNLARFLRKIANKLS